MTWRASNPRGHEVLFANAIPLSTAEASHMEGLMDLYIHLYKEHKAAINYDMVANNLVTRACRIGCKFSLSKNRMRTLHSMRVWLEAAEAWVEEDI